MSQDAEDVKEGPVEKREVRVNQRDRWILYLTVTCCLLVPWPVAILSRSYEAAGIAAIVPLMVGGRLLQHRGWSVPDTSSTRWARRPRK